MGLFMASLCIFFDTAASFIWRLLSVGLALSFCFRQSPCQGLNARGDCRHVGAWHHPISGGRGLAVAAGEQPKPALRHCALGPLSRLNLHQRCPWLHQVPHDHGLPFCPLTGFFLVFHRCLRLSSCLAWHWRVLHALSVSISGLLSCFLQSIPDVTQQEVRLKQV